MRTRAYTHTHKNTHTHTHTHAHTCTCTHTHMHVHEGAMHYSGKERPAGCQSAFSRSFEEQVPRGLCAWARRWQLQAAS